MCIVHYALFIDFSPFHAHCVQHSISLGVKIWCIKNFKSHVTMERKGCLTPYFVPTADIKAPGALFGVCRKSACHGCQKWCSGFLWFASDHAPKAKRQKGQTMKYNGMIREMEIRSSLGKIQCWTSTTSKASSLDFLSKFLQLLFKQDAVGPRCAECQGLFSYRCPSGLNSKITLTPLHTLIYIQYTQYTQYSQIHNVAHIAQSTNRIVGWQYIWLHSGRITRDY